MAPGADLVVAPIGPPPSDGVPAVVLGLSVCYDLRFPELYRIMALEGATVLVVPAAFTAVTGPAHWELLLRARAVENEAWVVGCGQVGALPPGMPTCHGHTMIVDPWGTVVAERNEPTPGFVDCRMWRCPRWRGCATSYRCWHIAVPRRTVGRMSTTGAVSDPGADGPHAVSAPPVATASPSPLPPFEVGMFESGGLQLYYEIHGHGPRVLVFMHGILMDSNMNRRLAVDLAGPRLPGGPARPAGPRPVGEAPAGLLPPDGHLRRARGGPAGPSGRGPGCGGWGLPGWKREPAGGGPGPGSGPGAGHRDAGAGVGRAGGSHHLHADAVGRAFRPTRRAPGGFAVPPAPPHRQRTGGQHHELPVQRPHRDGRRAPRHPGRPHRPHSEPTGGHGHPGHGHRAPGRPDPPVP